MMGSVICSSARKAYGSVQVLRDLSLAISDGEMGVVFGRSGCGKTTLLKCLCSYLPLDAGSIVYGAPNADTVAAEPRALRTSAADERAELLVNLWGKAGGRPRTIGLPSLWERPNSSVMMFADDSNLLHQLSAWQNLVFAAAPEYHDRAVRRDVVDLLLGLLDLTEVRDRRPSELSSGQKRRLSFAQCMLRRASLVALDEPTAALDTAAKYDLLALIQALHRAVGLTGVVVTHDIDAALLLADVIFLFDNGKIVAELRPDVPRPREPEGLDGESARSVRRELVRFVTGQRGKT